MVLKRYLSFFMRLAAVLSIAVFLAIVRPEFLSLNNIVNVLRQSSLLFILASGLTVVILTGGIDLSIGAVLALSACVMGTILKTDGMLLGILVGLVIGAGCGFMNGAMVAFIGLPSFMATYGMLWIAQGLALMFMKAEIIYGFPKAFRFFGAGGFLGIPAPIFFMFLAFGILYLLLTYTTVGRNIYSIGANMDVARISGIRVKRTLLIVYTVSGFFSAFAGMIYISRINAVEAGIGEPLLLPPLAAVCIGGTSLFGGEGSIGGTILGAIIMSLVINGMNMLGMTSFWQSFAVGTIVIFSVLIDQVRAVKFQTD
jgi:ribose transport system permease protein